MPTTIASMTGFARSHGASGAYSYEWEIKSVNAKGFDLRLRLPAGWDAVEQPARKAAAEALSRGTIYANLTIQRGAAAPSIRINHDILTSVMDAAKTLSVKTGIAPPTMDGLLALKGVLDITEPDENDDERRIAEIAVAVSFNEALSALKNMREAEGRTIGEVLEGRLARLAELAARADALPGRSAEAVRARLAEQIAALLETSDRFDADRLHQEAVLIATKADIREELDRIASHIAQARAMLAEGGAIGRRLDFLAQELNREVNTTCSKSNDLELTKIGLEMKNVVEQFREQVQNLE